MTAATETDRVLRVAWRVTGAPALAPPHSRAAVLPETVVALWNDGHISSCTVHGRFRASKAWARAEVFMVVKLRDSWPGWLRDLVAAERTE